jgi:hypothetical protein
MVMLVWNARRFWIGYGLKQQIKGIIVAEPKKRSYLGRALMGEFEPEYTSAEAHVDLEEILGDVINVSMSLGSLVSILLTKVSLDEDEQAEVGTLLADHQKGMEELRKDLFKVVNTAKEVEDGRN